MSMPGGRVVFIVDRDHAVRDSLRFSIELDEMDVRTFASARELLAHPELAQCCCAVIDGKTLHGDGPEVAMRLQAESSGLPIVLIADLVSRRLLGRTIALDSFHLVETPVLDDALLRCLRAVRRT